MDSENKVVPPSRAKVRWSDRPKLSAAAASRQGEAAKLAFEALGGRDAAIAYLNTVCGKLGGRPLDIAVGSVDGLGRVARALANIKAVR